MFKCFKLNNFYSSQVALTLAISSKLFFPATYRMQDLIKKHATGIPIDCKHAFNYVLVSGWYIYD